MGAALGLNPRAGNDFRWDIHPRHILQQDADLGARWQRNALSISDAPFNRFHIATARPSGMHNARQSQSDRQKPTT
jgi:hypothetical protein